MRSLHILVTILAFGVGSSMALADSSQFVPQGPVVGPSMVVLPAHENSNPTPDEKLARLESKIRALELRLNELLPKSPELEQSLSVVSNPYQGNRVQSMLGWSSQEHLFEAQANHQKAEVLEEKIQSIQDRIDRFSQKPYLDTKGFQRASLKLMRDDLVKELKDATSKIAWHKAEAKKIMLSETPGQQHS